MATRIVIPSRGTPAASSVAQDRREHQLVRHGARDVADENARALAAARELGERRRADRRGEHALEIADGIGQRHGVFVRQRAHDALVGQLDFEPRLPYSSLTRIDESPTYEADSEIHLSHRERSTS